MKGSSSSIQSRFSMSCDIFVVVIKRTIRSSLIADFVVPPPLAMYWKKCIVCMSEPRQVKFICRHFICCDVCASQVSKCPLCRVKTKIKITWDSYSCIFWPFNDESLTVSTGLNWYGARQACAACIHHCEAGCPLSRTIQELLTFLG